ncbi:MAG: hypothetical protein ABI707_20770, partial [Ferruginibacter sp.]
MRNIIRTMNFMWFLPAILIFSSLACGSKIKEAKDSIYSRHLQKHIDLTIISTPVPKEKNSFNLLLLNDGQDMEQLRVKEIVDSLYKKDLLEPLLVVAINYIDRSKEYGVAVFP